MVMIRGLVIFCFFSSAIAFGQQPVFYNYSTTEGLPSSEVYDILQDRNGYIWFSTDRGVSRFDGYTFTNYSTAEGLTNNTVFKLHEDPKGRIWFIPITAELCYFENGRIKQYAFNSKIRETRSNIISSFYCSENDEVYIGYQSKGIVKITKSGNMEDLTVNDTLMPSYSVFRINNRLLPYSKNPLFSKANNSVKFIFSDSAKTLPRILESQVIIQGVQRRNGAFVIYFSGYLAEINKQNEISIVKPSSYIVAVYEDSDSCLWIGYKNKGVHKYSPNENFSSAEYEEYLTGKTITCIFEDAERGIWLSSLADGVFYAPEKNFKTYSSSEKNNITSLELNLTKNGVLAGFDNGKVMDISLQNQKETFIENVTAKYVYSIISNGPYHFISSAKSIFILKRNTKFIEIPGVYSKNPCKWKDGIAGIGNYTLYTIDTTRFNLKTYNKLPFKGEVIFTDSKNNVWLGDYSGLYQFIDSVVIKSFPGDPLFSERVSAISELSDGRLVVATIGKGIIVVNPGNAPLVISEKTGLASSIVNCMAVDGNQVWAGTNNGISQLRINGNDFSITGYNVNKGLPGNEIIKIVIAENGIWAATRKQVVYFHPAAIRKNPASPRIHLSSVTASGRELQTNTEQEIYYNAFPIRVSFKGLSYKMRGKVTYRYRLNGLNEEWQYTTTPSVDFLSLPAGKYLFEIAAQNEDGAWSDQPAVFRFVIIPPFWKTTWFFILIVFAIVSVVILAAGFRIRVIKKRNRLMTDLLTYRQQALTMQMNPHFIFNSLNSIQSFILTEEKKLATRYISRFAKLMRQSLENSRHEYITLSEETEVLKLYLELETLRFKNLFGYSIEVDPAIPAEHILIPSMIIQPFVENCVKHAFTNEHIQNGNISIHIKKQEDMLVCEIEDNGVGFRKTTQKKENQEHHSAGMNITEQRLKLLHSAAGQKLFFSIVDKSEKNKIDSGTIVTFTIPYKTKNG